jgi:FixJ family two-component response regulator
MDKTGTVFIIDDDKSIRRSLSLFLGASGFTVETYSSSEEYLEKGDNEGTGCIILDVNLSGKSGLELQEELIERGSSLPIIFMTGQGNIPMSVQTLKKGAVNFLEKPFKDEELLQSVEEALERSRKLTSEREELRAAQSLVETLTPRELEILKFLHTGMLNKQIASELDIAEQTVKIHRHSISEKLGTKSLAGIIRISSRAGII